MNTSTNAVEQIHEYLIELEKRIKASYPIKILSCVSGGIDSMTMLLLLKAVEKKYNTCTVSAAHVAHNYQDRKEQKHEIEVVDAICHALAIPIYRKEIRDFVSNEESTETARRKMNENKLRDLRYACLYEIAQEQNLFILATAHHLDDQFETIVSRIFAKDGIRGLSGIPSERCFRVEHLVKNVGLEKKNTKPEMVKSKDQFSGILIRPLLQFSKKELHDIHQELCHDFKLNGSLHQDKSNFEERFLRNKVRTSVIPALESVFPYAQLATVSLAEQMRQLLWDSGQRNLHSMLATTQGLRVKRSAYPWFVFDDGLRLSRFYYDRCSKTQMLNLLYLAANFMGLRRVPQQSLSMFLNLNTASNSSSLDIQNTQLRATQGFLIWDRSNVRKEEDLNIEIVENCYFVFKNKQWSVHRAQEKEDPWREKALLYSLRYSGNLLVKNVKKDDIIKSNAHFVNVKDALCCEKEKSCIILYDGEGVLMAPGESLLKRTLIRDAARIQNLNKRHSDAEKRPAIEKTSCVIQISYQYVGLKIL